MNTLKNSLKIALAPTTRHERMASQRGFSLIELMFVVVVMAILAAIAISSYSKFVQRSRRSDAYATLTQDQGMLERCYALTFNYQNAVNGTGNCAQIVTTSQEGYYSITATGSTTTTYTLTAVPAAGSPQAQDTTCASFSINNANNKTAQNSGGADESSTCWQQ